MRLHDRKLKPKLQKYQIFKIPTLIESSRRKESDFYSMEATKYIQTGQINFTTPHGVGALAKPLNLSGHPPLHSPPVPRTRPPVTYINPRGDGQQYPPLIFPMKTNAFKSLKHLSKRHAL